MEISYRGKNCVIIKSKNGMIITDPSADLRISEVGKDSSITLLTDDSINNVKDANFVISMPGEYEHNDISITGIPAQRLIDPNGKKSTIYSISIDGVKIAAIGHIQSPIGDDDLESLGNVDIAIIPIGGGGYTLDARDASSVIRQLSPKIVIPTHYADKNTTYEVPQDDLELFFNEMSAIRDKVSSLKIKNGSLPEVLTVYEIIKS